MTDYNFALLFNNKAKKKVVTNVDFQVTSVTDNVELPQDTMPDELHPGDTITFNVDYTTHIEKLKSCLFTSYPVNNSPGESPFAPPNNRASIDFIAENLFGKPLEVAQKRKGAWIFHMMGLYRGDKKNAAYYLDPEATCG